MGACETQAGPGEADTCDHRPILQAAGNAVLILQKDLHVQTEKNRGQRPAGYHGNNREGK